MDFIATNEKTFQKQVSKPKVRSQVRRVKLWTRLSPAHLLRVFVDNYVKGCITFGKDSNVDAHASAFQVSLVREASQSRRAQGIPSAQELNHDLASKFSHQGSGHGAAPEQESALNAWSVDLPHNDLTMTDLQGHSGPLHKVGASRVTMADPQAFSSPLRSPANAFNAAPESKQHSDTTVSGDGLESVLQTSALHTTGFLQSASRRRAAFGAHRLIPRGGCGRLRRARSRSASSPAVPPIAMSWRPLTPVTDMSTFREQSHRRKPSRRSSSRSASTLAVRRPNPSRDYDARAPPPIAASPQPFLDAM